MSELRKAIYGEIGRLCELETAFYGNLPEHQKRIDNSTDAILDAVIAALPEWFENPITEVISEPDDYEKGKQRYYQQVKSILLEAKEK